jgi:hypothetical protein
VSEAAHGTAGRWNAGCHCTLCRRAHSDAQRRYGRARAQKRLPVEVRQQLLDAIYAGQPFRTALRDLGLTSNQVWGLTRTDQEWSAALEAALAATRRDDLEHATNAAYVAGCVCNDCRNPPAAQNGQEPAHSALALIRLSPALATCRMFGRITCLGCPASSSFVTADRLGALARTDLGGHLWSARADQVCRYHCRYLLLQACRLHLSPATRKTIPIIKTVRPIVHRMLVGEISKIGPDTIIISILVTLFTRLCPVSCSEPLGGKMVIGCF